KAERAVREAESLEDLVPLLETAFLCGFPELFRPLRDRILEIYSLSETINPLLISLRTLTFADQYGDIRYSEKPDIAGLTDRIGARAAYLLPFVAGQLSEEEDAVLRTQLRELQYILALPRYRNIRNHFSNAWLQI